jgi:hypothetical protein
MLNTLSSPVRYAIAGFFAGIIGMFISSFMFENTADSWLLTPLAAAVGGYIGGRISQKRGKS